MADHIDKNESAFFVVILLLIIIDFRQNMRITESVENVFKKSGKL